MGKNGLKNSPQDLGLMERGRLGRGRASPGAGNGNGVFLLHNCVIFVLDVFSCFVLFIFRK